MIVKLQDSDKHYWGPTQYLLDWLESRIPEGAQVLEVGPGTSCFRRADVFVDVVDAPSVPEGKLLKHDIAVSQLPFPDKFFDFAYCRHTLEDMYDPFAACREMSRVAKRGYIETPSPIAELCRGVDGGSPDWRGYHHHRFFVWEQGGELQFVAKYPVVEHARCNEESLVGRLKLGPQYWSTYYLWEDEIRFRHLQTPQDFVLDKGYADLLMSAITQSAESANRFLTGVIATATAA